MGKLLWAIQAWHAEMENSEKPEAIKAGQAKARAEGKQMGRPQAVFDRGLVVRLRDQEHLSWPGIARRTAAGVGTVVRAYRDRNGTPNLSKSLTRQVYERALNQKGFPRRPVSFEM
jgi:DNA invertase Pin-like site-specific DNA recombinase